MQIYAALLLVPLRVRHETVGQCQRCRTRMEEGKDFSHKIEAPRICIRLRSYGETAPALPIESC